MTRELGNGAVIVQGVEFDGYGHRVAYHVLPYRPHDQFANYAPPVRVQADEILHIMKPLAAGLPIATSMPEGTRIQSAGNAEVMGEISTQFGLAMGAGILLVYVVLVLLFASFVTPVTILLSLPLAIAARSSHSTYTARGLVCRSSSG